MFDFDISGSNIQWIDQYTLYQGVLLKYRKNDVDVSYHFLAYNLSKYVFFKLSNSNCSIAMLFNNITFWKKRLFYDVTFRLLLLSSVLLLLTTWDMYGLTSKIVKYSTCLKIFEWWRLKHMTKCYIHMHFKWIYML